MRLINKKIYLAGRISKHDWRDHGIRDEAFVNGEGVDDILVNGFQERVETFGDYSFTRTGPYFVGCDHGCGHGPNKHGLGLGNDLCIEPRSFNAHESYGREQTVARCLEAIRGSDIVFAWLEPEAYGTVAEIGYAKALGKDIYCAHPIGADVDDLWFASKFASTGLTAFPTPTEAFTMLLAKFWSAQSVVDVVESPIEGKFLVALNRMGCPFRLVGNVVQADFVDFKVYPQYTVGAYRLDFAFISDAKHVAVKLDGHDFHERTKEQAQRDKKRDRDLQAAGWSVLRFTGSEVFKDAAKCAAEAVAIMRSTR